MKNFKFRIGFVSMVTVLGLGISSGAFAEETVTTFPPGGAQDVLENPAKHPAKQTTEEIGGDAGGAIKMKTDCKTKDGKTISKGQKGYEACLKHRLENPHK